MTVRCNPLWCVTKPQALAARASWVIYIAHGAHGWENKRPAGGFWAGTHPANEVVRRVANQIVNRNGIHIEQAVEDKGKSMKYKTDAAAITLTLLALFNAPALAQGATPEHQLSYNAALVSDYRYRGLSQTRLDPALQGGADYVHASSGLYAGAWLSTIKWTRDLGGDGHVELDVYGGKRGQFSESVTYDVGGLYYWYPSNVLAPSANTFELYGRLGFGPAYVKYSHSTTNLFGTADSRGSGYLDLGADLDIGSGFILNLHAGHQKVAHNSQYSYADFKVGVTKDVGVATLSVAWIKANTDSYLSPRGDNLGKSGAIVTLSKTF
jgi:uncharacterized protein (TIGR02001 family)